MSDGWNYEPFDLTHDVSSGRLYGRGSTDDKGPVLGWLHVIEAHQKTGIEMPVNLKMCFEGMEESGSVGLAEFVEREKDAFFAGVDVVCISDNYVSILCLMFYNSIWLICSLLFDGSGSPRPAQPSPTVSEA